MVNLYKVAIYSRKSRLTEKGESIQNQIAECKQHANRKFKVSEFIIYEDEGYSGGNTDRPKYQLMLEDAKKKRFDILICYRLDRISRNISHFSSTMDLLENNDIAFVSVKEEFDTSSPMGRAMMYIASVFAQLERETIAERIKDNMLALARTGRWLGGQTPTGFESKPISYLDENMNKRKMFILSPVERELKLVKQLYSKYIEFDSLSKLESWALERHIKTKNNKDFDKSALKLILTNPVYAIADELLYEYFEKNNCDIASPKKDFDGNYGVMVFNKNDQTKKNKIIKKDMSEWIVAIAKHEGTVFSKDWIKIQNMIKKNSKKAPRINTGEVGLITPLLRCKHCGSKMRISIYRRKGGTYYYYRCLMKERSKGTRCDVANLSGPLADELVVNEIKDIRLREESLLKKLNEDKQINSKLAKQQKSKENTLKKELKSYKDSINSLTLQLSYNPTSIAAKYIVNQIEEFDQKINKIKQELEALKEDKESTLIEKMNIDGYIDLLKNFSSNIDILTFEEKKRYLKELVDTIIWDGEKLEIIMMGYNNVM
ncbi:recombinase family protein [Tepidibacter sp. Z1-5]|uniref:recombinase family protein n=1 Tax=Tepidibacter sp. Z1-5 TaxID=3134138 RepID=UPI0030BF0C27